MLVHYYIPLYDITREIIPDLETKKVLDFGSNYGLFLESSDGRFPHENYTGVDVCDYAIETGRRMFPDAKFIYYDGYNPEYNPGGKDPFPKIDEKYDIIVIHSVFTHTSEEDMLNIVDNLYPLLEDGGKMVVYWTGYDPSFKRPKYGPIRDEILRFFPEHKDMDYCYVYQYTEDGKNKTKITQEFPTEPIIAVWSYYNVNYFKTLFTKYNTEYILSRDWKQDVVLISRS